MKQTDKLDTPLKWDKVIRSLLYRRFDIKKTVLMFDRIQ